MIDQIENGEGGGSVRAKINASIDVSNLFIGVSEKVVAYDTEVFSNLSSQFGYPLSGRSKIVSPGDMIRVVGIGSTYQVADPSASDAALDYTGSGGVKLNPLQITDGRISAAAFGLPTDGVTPCLSLLQAADSAAAALGCGVLLPPGTYRTNGVLTLNASWSGYGATIKFVDALSAGAVATASVAQTNAENLTFEGITFDGNRANQSWTPAGSANYGLAIRHGGVTIRDCRTINVTGNGTGVPTKTGTGLVTFINHVSQNNGKKGFHSGVVSGIDIFGGEWSDGQIDSGIGVHQGATDVKIIGVTCRNNATYGIHVGNSLGTQSRRVQIVSPVTEGNGIAGILFAGEGNAWSDLRVDTTVTGGRIADKLVAQAAAGFAVVGTEFAGCNVELDNVADVKLLGTRHTGTTGTTDPRIRVRGVNLGGTTITNSQDVDILYPEVDTTGTTEAISFAGVTSGRIIEPDYVGTAPTGNNIRLFDNERAIRVQSAGKVRLGSYTLAQQGVFDDPFRRVVYANAAPTVGTWAQGDIMSQIAPTLLSSGQILVERVCTAAGSPGTWEPVYAATGLQDQQFNVADGVTTVPVPATGSITLRFNNTAATTVTALSGGQPGQRVRLITANTNTTIQRSVSGTSGGLIRTAKGANIALVVDGAIDLQRDAGSDFWRVVAVGY